MEVSALYSDIDLTVMAANIARLSELDVIRRELLARGVAILYLKGAAFVDTLYSNPAARKMVDVDVLVPGDKVSIAEEALRRRGFFWATRARRVASAKHGYERVYTRDGAQPMNVGLHTAFCQSERFNIDYDGVHKRAVVYETPNRVVPTLAPEDHVLHLALHQGKEAFRTERNGDLARIFSTWTPNWGIVVRRAREWELTANLYATLLGASSAKVPVPNSVLQQLKPPRWQRCAISVLLRTGGTARFTRPARLWQGITLAATLSSQRRFALSILAYARLRWRDCAFRWNCGDRPRYPVS